MGHWIDEAEKRQKDKNVYFESGNKEENVVINENHLKITPFISQLNELTKRVSNLSPEERKPSIEVGQTHLEGDLRYEYYGSAFRVIDSKFLLLFHKKKNYLFWRRIYFTVTDTPDLIKITLYEKGTSDQNQEDIIKKKYKFITNIHSLQSSLNYSIIDWLVFKISNSELKHHLPSVK